MITFALFLHFRKKKSLFDHVDVISRCISYMIREEDFLFLCFFFSDSIVMNNFFLFHFFWVKCSEPPLFQGPFEKNSCFSLVQTQNFVQEDISFPEPSPVINLVDVC